MRLVFTPKKIKSWIKYYIMTETDEGQMFGRCVGIIGGDGVKEYLFSPTMGLGTKMKGVKLDHGELVQIATFIAELNSKIGVTASELIER